MRFVLIASLLAFFGCQAASPDTPATASDAHTSEDSLDWEGTYRGTLPCADCEGIDTTLELAANRTYELSTHYLGKAGTTSVRKGSFAWQKNGSVIELDLPNGARFFRVEENRLRQLDTRGNRIQGKLADKYVLTKVAHDTVTPADAQAQPTALLEKTHWKLVSLGSSPATVANDQAEPHFILHPTDKRVSGSGGCNRLMGFYTLEGDKLHFSRMAGTMRACVSGMEQEREFHRVLGAVDAWRIHGESLDLLDASGMVIARFESRGMD